MIALCTSEPA